MASRSSTKDNNKSVEVCFFEENISDTLFCQSGSHDIEGLRL
jgi:hypothetical protein